MEQPTSPHWPHASTQHARPLEDSTPGIPLLQNDVSPTVVVIGAAVAASVVGAIDDTAIGAGVGASLDSDATSI